MAQTIVDDARPHQLAQALKRYVLVVVVLVLAAGAAGWGYASTRPTVYSSSARILLRPSVGNPLSTETGSSGQQVTIAMTTEAALVNSGPVLTLVNKKVQPALSTTDIKVSVPPSTQIILATVTASSATRAQTGAQAVAEAYLSYRQSITEATRKSRVDQLTKQKSSVSSDLSKAGDTAAKNPTSAEATRRLQVLTDQLISVQDALSQAEGINTDPGTLVSPAVAGKRTGVDPRLIAAGGALLGLFLGLALALFLGRRDKRVHARASSTVAGVPILAVFGARRGSDRAVADKQAYQRLRTSILASTALPSAVAVSGVGPRDSSTGVAVELGRSMHRAGYRVALVMASAEEAGPFAEDARGARGLAEALRGERNVLSLLTGHDGLMVLPAGSGILEQQELLSGERFARVVAELKASFDYVLVVTGPASLPAELATARVADAVLLVGRDGATSRVDVADVAGRAELVGLRISGLAVRPRREAAAPKPPHVPEHVAEPAAERVAEPVPAAVAAEESDGAPVGGGVRTATKPVATVAAPTAKPAAPAAKPVAPSAPAAKPAVPAAKPAAPAAPAAKPAPVVEDEPTPAPAPNAAAAPTKAPEATAARQTGAEPAAPATGEQPKAQPSKDGAPASKRF